MDEKNKKILNNNKNLYISVEMLEKKMLTSSPRDFKLLLKRIDSLMNFIR